MLTTVQATPTPIMPDIGTSTLFMPTTLSVVKATMVKMNSMDNEPHATRAAAFASTSGSLASPLIVPPAHAMGQSKIVSELYLRLPTH
jgi:hypothetical protein